MGFKTRYSFWYLSGKFLVRCTSYPSSTIKRVDRETKVSHLRLKSWFDWATSKNYVKS